MKSRVHPNCKSKYRVGNWAEYDCALVQRGDITLWMSKDAVEAWRPAPSGKRGGQGKYSDAGQALAAGSGRWGMTIGRAGSWVLAPRGSALVARS